MDGRLREAGCWAHARHKFEEALESEPLGANHALVTIGQLYAVESDAREREQTGNALLARRQTETRDLLHDFRQWLDEQAASALPKSAFGKGVGYTRRHGDALTRFLSDPRIPPDSNLSERCLRAVAVGRNNYLFAGSDKGAETAAALYSVVTTCKLHGVDPYAYLADVLDCLCVHSSNRMPASGIRDLLPDRWTPRPAEQ